MNQRILGNLALIAILAACSAVHVSAAPRKGHTVVLGAIRKEAYSRAGDPAGAGAGETELNIRALLVDGALKEWTTGDRHDVTDRSFVVRRALRLNDALPGDKVEKWVWQRGPWLLVDRTTGHVTALKLADYDPGVSQVSWFRDYAAYCGLTASGKSLYAVVVQVAGRKPVLAKRLAAFDAENRPDPVCTAPLWQRDPMRVTFYPAGRQQGVGFDVAPGSAVLVEDSADDADSPEPPRSRKRPGMVRIHETRVGMRVSFAEAAVTTCR